MESMRRSEANSSHHPNKVAVNNLATESNKQSSGSGSLNNNKLSFNQQQQTNSLQVQQQNQQKSSSCSSASSSSSTTSSSSSSGASTSSESKDTNFEYDDNEWDVGGIGDLIIDLDADIEKSSSTAASNNQQQNSQTQQQNQQQLSSSLSAAISGLGNIGGGTGSNQGQLCLLNANEKSPDSSSSSSSTSSSPTTVSSSKSSLSSLFSPISIGQSPGLQKQGSGNISASLTPTKQSTKHSVKSQNLKQQQPALVAQLNSCKSSSDSQRLSSAFVPSSRGSQSSSSSAQGLQLDRHSKLPSTTASMSSQPSGGQGAGKAATKMSIDHQATLDKGLKMKIKRTKPGTKTSEAKHEIVKAEQNGTSSSIEESNISSNSSSGKKHSQVNTTPSVQPIPAQQGTKRGSSSHRRDKTRDKTPHSREKSEHSSSTGSGSNGNSNNSSSSSHSNSSSGNERSSSSSSSTSCNCSHDLQMNGLQTPCTNISCIRNRTSAGIDQQNTPLAQRIAAASSGQSNTNNTMSANSTSSSSIGSNSNSGNNPTTVFSSNSGSGNAQTSSNNTPNAPGPPKESKNSNSALSNHQQSSPQLSNSTNSLPNAQQQQQQQSQQNPPNLNSTTAMHSNSSQNNSSNKTSGSTSQSGSISATVHHTITVAANSALAASLSNCDDATSSPPPKRIRCDPKDMVDICVGTSVGTITEPDCLGPCEPGTSVTLEGIVWHETEGGVLVVNVTWRGKTYVGTLLDCTRHDWAPPRFCDSPTEELDSRTPKGRGKRGRSAALTPDLSNFTETRSSVHSKLRNGGAKGRGGRGVTTASSTATTTTTTTTSATTGNSSSSNSSSTTNSNTPSTSPTAFLPPRPEKRKSKDESPSPVNGETGAQSSQTQSLVNPVTGLNVQISTKKCKTASPSAISPVLLECPEQDCSKKYKHANGLRYHQSHAHGSGSMDEDSLQLPESPRVAPPTTPSPAPATTPQPQVSVSSSTTTTTSIPTSTAGVTSGPLTSSAPTTPVSSPSSMPITTSAVQPTPVVSVSSGGGLLTTVQSSVATPQAIQPAPQQPQIPQHTIPGGSITAGISGQALSQHQQHSMLVGTVPSSGILTSNNQIMSEAGQPPLAPQQPQAQQPPVHVSSGGITATPTRGDPPSKIKPGVLRFGPPSDNVPGGQNPLSSQSPLRPTPTAAMAPNSGPPSTPESAHQPQYSQPPPSGQQGKPFPELSNLPEALRGHSQSGVSVPKPQNYGKQKKNRKSPVPGDFDSSTSRDDVQSPAYSDISDDSTPVVDPEIIDKSQAVKLPDIKKVQEGAPPQIPPLGGYGMYQFYSQQPYMVPPDHQAAKPPPPQSTLPPSSPAEYNKNKEPPLDLMTKPSQQSENNTKESNVPQSSGPGAPNPTKPMSHFYPFNYMPPGYSYNMDPNYGPVSMVSDENKLNQVQNAPPSMKEERTKESPSPHGHDHAKITGQVRTPPAEYGKIGVGLDHSQPMMPTKLIKNEPPPKEIKQETNSHPMHQKEPTVQSLGGYPSIYQRHSMGVPSQPQQHMSREEELRRYYIYPDQRRSNPQNNSSGPNVPTVKEEPVSPSQPSMQHPSASALSQSQQSMSQMSSSVQNQPQQQSQNSSQQKSSKSSLPGSQSSSGQKATNLIKDIKEEKEVKVKQEGQKPTMETQGPPPPPTSQYFLHPSYISPGPFGFDPGHPMYRNVLMSTGPYNTPPYHLPMARFHAPEDLSRNPGTKALDALHHAASQYYTTHKIHELSERALKSPTSSNVKVSVSSPNVSQQSGTNSGNSSNGGGNTGPGGILPPSSAAGGPLNLQPPSGSLPPGIGSGGVPLGAQKGDGKSSGDPTGKPGVVGSGVGVGGGPTADSRSPPPQRHVHTHHHTHVGLGYPMYPAPYGAAVLASQQAAAVAVINPFPPGPTK